MADSEISIDRLTDISKSRVTFVAENDRIMSNLLTEQTMLYTCSVLGRLKSVSVEKSGKSGHFLF